MSDPVIVGNFGKTFGVLGWIKINSFTFPQKHILNFQPWLIKKNGSWEEICLEDSKQHLNSIVVKLPSCNSPEEVRRFTNIEIGVWRKQLPKLQSGEYYWMDLIGLQVINLIGFEFGTVQEIMATGANDVLVVNGDRKRLVPYISSVIRKVDLEKKAIFVDWDQDF
jgi:16S rRNA processing protein RimM